MRGLAEMLALGLVYFASAWLGLTQATLAGAASPVWPATGVSLAGLYLLGLSRWPGLFVGAFLSALWFGSVSPAAALAMGVGNTLEAVLGVLLLRRLGFSPSLTRIQDVLALTGAAAACTLASVLPGALSLVLSGVVQTWGGTALTAWVWWLGNAMGALVMGSAVMLLAQPSPEPRWREALGLAALTLGVGVWSFSRGHQGSPLAFAQVFLLFPLGVWAALRFGARGAALSTLLIAVVSIWGTVAGHGPFASLRDGRTVDLPELQLFLAVIALTGLLLAAARAERGEACAQLELLASAMRSVREGVLISELRPDEGPRLVYANESFRRMVGWTEEELVGRSPRELCGGEVEPEAHRRLETALREAGFFRGEVVLAHKDGSRVHCELQLFPVRNAGGQVAHFVATHRDI
ncbi:MAG: MASE1 domain-containing protein, partial [Archangium sp.]